MYVESKSRVRRGSTNARNAAVAAEEIYNALYHPSAALSVFFCSTDYDLHALEQELAHRFDGVPLVGCTSANEITPAGYAVGGIGLVTAKLCVLAIYDQGQRPSDLRSRNG